MTLVESFKNGLWIHSPAPLGIAAPPLPDVNFYRVAPGRYAFSSQTATYTDANRGLEIGVAAIPADFLSAAAGLTVTMRTQSAGAGAGGDLVILTGNGVAARRGSFNVTGASAGIQTTMIGATAGGLSTGQDCTFLGFAAGRDAIAAVRCTFVGSSAGLTATGDDNTASGYNASIAAGFTQSIAMGSSAACAGGSLNIVLGFNSTATGASNVLIGPNAIVTGSGTVAIGASTNVAASNSTAVGVSTSAGAGSIALGYGASAGVGVAVMGSNGFPIGILYGGKGETNIAPISWIISGTAPRAGTDANTNGGDLHLRGGLGTGNGICGDVDLFFSRTVGAGSGLQTAECCWAMRGHTTPGIYEPAVNTLNGASMFMRTQRGGSVGNTTGGNLIFQMGSPGTAAAAGTRRGYFNVTGVTAGVRTTFIGENSGGLSTGTDCTFLGYNAGAVAVAAIGCTFVGASAGAANTTGFSTFVGAACGAANTTGGQNTALGYQALTTCTTSFSMTAVGYRALATVLNLGRDNTAVGNQAGEVLAGSYGTFVGSLAGNAVTGNDNTCIGALAGQATLTTGQSNTLIGRASNVVAAATNNGVALGATAVTRTGSVAIGYGATATADYQYMYGAFSTIVATQRAATTGSPVFLTLTGAAHTTLTAAVECTDVYFNLARQVEFTNGAGIALQRAMRIAPPTYAFTAGANVTIVNASTLYVDGPPVAGTRCVITNPYAAYFNGATYVNGKLTVTGLVDPTGLVLTEQVGVPWPFAPGYGAVWVKNDTPSTLWFTDDTGATVQLGVAGGVPGGANTNIQYNNAGAFGGSAELTFVVATGCVTLTQPIVNAATPNLFVVTGGAHTALLTGAEATDVNFNLARTVQFDTGAIALQRAVNIAAPTYAFVAGSTITTAATFYITNAPQLGLNATFTDSYALMVAAGRVRFDGALLTQLQVLPIAAGTVVVNVRDSNTVYTNEGAGALVQMNLPATAVGLTYTFVVKAAQTFRIWAAAGSTVRMSGNISGVSDRGAGDTVGNVTSANIGSTVTFVAVSATEWVAVSIVGQWNLV